MVGGETCGGCGWRGRGARGGGFISGGMLSVSKDTHFTHTGQKHTAHPHRRSSCLRPPSLLDHFYLSNLIYPRSRFFLIFSSFVSNLFSPLPPSCPPSHSVFCSPPHLSSPPFQVLSRPNAPCQPDFIPPFSRPVFPARHAHLRVSCMFSDSPDNHFFFFFSATDQAVPE